MSMILSRLNPELPKTKCVDVIVIGGMSQYIPLLDFYCGGLPLLLTGYTSSKACFRINLNPLSKPFYVYYTFLPYMAYLKFLPMDKENREKAQKLQFKGASN
ncbi:GH3 family - like 10 [Theobroma cacao]|nr:GH3 family - like 10 [Theobroma cacao]